MRTVVYSGISLATAVAAADEQQRFTAEGVQLPTPAQVRYLQSEIIALTTFNMGTYANNKDLACAAKNWDTKNPPTGPTSDVATFNPKKLNTTQWADVMTALGAKVATLTAKHFCGFLLWNTSTQFPDGTPYTYHVGAPGAFQTDIIASFRDSMEAAGLTYGYYYILNWNFYTKVGAFARGRQLPGQHPLGAEAYRHLVMQQLEELWSNYGQFAEIWLDGGIAPAMREDVKSLLAKLQPNAASFDGCSEASECVTNNSISWIGTEWANASCQDMWITGIGQGSSAVSRGTINCGNLSSTRVSPKSSDMTMQVDDQWFYEKNLAVRSLEWLINAYHNSVGQNAAMELDFAIDRDGLVNPVHEARYREFGQWIRDCYGTPFGRGELTKTTLGNGAYRVEFEVSQAGTVDRAVLREDIAQGQRVRSWTLTVGDAVVGSAKSIGNRRVVQFDKKIGDHSKPATKIEVAAGTKVILEVTSIGEPQWMQVDLFAAAPCMNPTPGN